MAEFCLDCLNKINEAQDGKWRFIMSLQKDLCEECGEYKRVVITEHIVSRVQRVLSEAVENMKHR